uniref:RNA ligase with polynucleotide kinase domain n=1 Tax=Marseillevirus LCMAC201 TaxID=2506605 RepID=A0A481YYE5_9VIRU|nr:MAG: RNA ligase with polynucleotide kinase domain [Marseillevirus LCMAC201]
MEQHQINNELVVSTDRRFLSRDPATPELLKSVGVGVEWTEYIRVLDRQNKLALLHYVNTWVSSTDHTINETPLKDIGHVRGIIVDTDTGKIICRSFPYTPEVSSENTERIGSIFPQDLSEASVYTACEGTVIRLFWYGEEWNISTHRKIDANNSYWAGPTFGSMFRELRGFSLDDLDKNYCYAFLMSHNGNRLVYKITKPQLMLIAIYDYSKQCFLSDTEMEPVRLSGCVYPSPVIDINTITDLREAVDELEKFASYNHAGIIVIPDSQDPRPIKIVNATYNSIRDARGNESSIRTRYIQLRGTTEGKLLIKWFAEPDQEIFDDAEKEIDKLVLSLHIMYMNRYVHKNFARLPKEEFVTLQNCHTWHTSDRSNIVTVAKVREYLDTIPTYYLLLMLNRQRREKRKAEREAQSTVMTADSPEFVPN